MIVRARSTRSSNPYGETPGQHKRLRWSNRPRGRHEDGLDNGLEEGVQVGAAIAPPHALERDMNSDSSCPPMRRVKERSCALVVPCHAYWAPGHQIRVTHVPLVQRHRRKGCVVQSTAYSADTEEMDYVFGLPYARNSASGRYR